MFDHHEHQQNRVIRRVAEAALSDATSGIMDTHSAVKTLAITVTLEAVAIAMFIIANEKVAELINSSPADFWFYGGAVFFLTGFFTAFAGYTLLANRWPQRNAGFFLWVLSFAVGALNLLLFFALSGMAAG